MNLRIGIPTTLTPHFGLALCVFEGKGYVEGIDPHGSVGQWNSEVAPEIQVCIGDRINAFEVKGQGLQKLTSGKEFLYVKSRAIVLKVTKPSIYTVKGKSPFGLGMKLRLDSHKTFFVVSIQQWNKEFPDRQVSAGDVVREVNGVKGSAGEVLKMLANDPDEEKELLVFHYPNMV